MPIRTADLYDDFADELQIAEPLFSDYGGRAAFHGEIATVKVFEDNVLVKETLNSAGAGRVLVVDGGGSTRCALLGDIIVYGAIRDAAEIRGMDLGVKALATCPAKSVKRGEGQYGIPVRFAGITFRPRDYVYADEDGIVTSDRVLAGEG